MFFPQYIFLKEKNTLNTDIFFSLVLLAQFYLYKYVYIHVYTCIYIYIYVRKQPVRRDSNFFEAFDAFRHLGIDLDG